MKPILAAAVLTGAFLCAVRTGALPQPASPPPAAPPSAAVPSAAPPAPAAPVPAPPAGAPAAPAAPAAPGGTPFPTAPPDVDRGTYVPATYVEVHIDGAPMWNAFVDTDVQTVKDYTFTLTSHEVEGATTEDRVYHFAYMKPSYAFSNVISGRSAGTGAVWHGGNKIKGHLAGFFAHLKAVMPINDPRAVDLRGKTLVAGFFPWIINGFELASGGKITEAPGPTVDGVATTAVTMHPLDPKRDGNCDTEQLLLSNTTHLPVEHDCFVGSINAEHEIFSEMKVNNGLTPAYFDFI